LGEGAIRKVLEALREGKTLNNINGWRGDKYIGGKIVDTARLSRFCDVNPALGKRIRALVEKNRIRAIGQPRPVRAIKPSIVLATDCIMDLISAAVPRHLPQDLRSVVAGKRGGLRPEANRRGWRRARRRGDGVSEVVRPAGRAGLQRPVQSRDRGGAIMSTIVEFPIADRPITEREIDKLHSVAFRDLEGGIADCTTMAKIAAQMVANEASVSGELVFLVCHVREMLDVLKANYYAAWDGEKRGTS
jgi:hypothetical protein